jgi:trimethylamine:corrinoid methyltransferase-like protein
MYHNEMADRKLILLAVEGCPVSVFPFFSLGATAPVWALAYLHETLSFTSVF